MAAMNTRNDVAAILISKGADLNSKDKVNTALILIPDIALLSL